MKTRVFPITIISFVVCGLLQTTARVSAETLAHEVSDSIIFFDKPARENGKEKVFETRCGIWQRYSLPVGNGSMGITSYGGVEEEVLVIASDKLWSGRYNPKADKPDSYKALPAIRELVIEGKIEEAEVLSRQELGSAPGAKDSFGSFSVFGRLLIESDLAFRDVSDYRRSLDIETAVSTVHYKSGENTYKRTLFTSYPDQVAVMRYELEGPGKQQLKLSFEHPHGSNLTTRADGNELIITGTQADSELRLDARVRVKAEGAEIVTGPDFIEIKNAGTVELHLAADTSYDIHAEKFLGEPKDAAVAERVKISTQRSCEQLLDRHLEDYQHLYKRVELDVGASDVSTLSLPMDQRLKRYREGGTDPDLEELLFQYGRYLMIGSSRPGSLPANLQGVWNNGIIAPWDGDYHLDINLQMNYWLTGSTNLLECQEPLIDFLEMLMREGRKTAQAYFNADGWTVMIVSNIWGFTTSNSDVAALTREKNPRKLVWTYFPTSGPWITFHAYDHYSYGQDRKMLEERLWPILSSSADFVVDFLYELPDGTYTAVPSWSPEHGKVSTGATAAIAICREVLDYALRVAGELGVHDDRTREYRHVMDHLVPYKIGQHGQLQEWYEDRDKPEEKHRHINHLIGLHPGSQISPLTTPELAEAAHTSLQQRQTMSTGWSLAWKLNCMARLLEDDEAYSLIRMLLSNRVAPNLWTLHPPFQIDANFGATSGIAEVLLQSHLGEIHVLPAIPDAWPTGHVKGLRARGGFTFEIAWENGVLNELKIKSDNGKPLKIRYKDTVIEHDLKKGQSLQLNGSLQKI